MRGMMDRWPPKGIRPGEPSTDPADPQLCGFFRVWPQAGRGFPCQLALVKMGGMFGMSLSPGAFAVLHKGGAMALLVAAGLHVVLNWGWVKANYLKALFPGWQGWQGRGPCEVLHTR